MEYKISSIDTKVELFKIKFHSIIEEIKTIFGNSEGKIILKEAHEVLIGKFCEGNIIFKEKCLNDEDLFIDMRVFDKHKELYIFKNNNELCCRLRVDGEGKTLDILDEELLLWGQKEVKDDFIVLKEEKVKDIYVPFQGNKENNEMKLIIRNYIDKNDEDGTCEKIDFRAVDIK